MNVRSILERGAAILCLVSGIGLCSCKPPVLTPSERLEAAGAEAAQLLSAVSRAGESLRLTEALVLADSLIRIAPDLPDGYYEKGLILMKLYQLEPADDAFARAAEIDPYHRGAWYQRGHVAFEQGRYDVAAQRYRRQQEVILSSPQKLKAYYSGTDPESVAQAWLQVGRAYQLHHIPDSARVAYVRVIKVDSLHSQANAWLSEIYEQEGDLDEALALARLALDNDRSNAQLGYQVGSLLFKKGDLKEALPLLAWTATSQPWNAGAHYNLGRTLVALGRPEEGRRHLEATEFLQDLDREIGQARAAAALFPDDPERWRHVADLLGLAGRRTEQREALSIADAAAHRAAKDSSNVTP